WNSISFVLIFFFQAEDGIRDFHVTGVQTCALPIFAFKQDAAGGYPINNFVSQLKNVKITGNKAVRDDGHYTEAGGVYVDGRFNIDFEDFTISNNEATGSTAIVIVKNEGATINFTRGKI